MISKFLYTCIIITLVLLIYFTIFYRLDSNTIFVWDEGRLAVNAIEMYQNGFSFIPTYENKPDMWNVKPPLMIWLQTTSMHFIGVNELAVRIPSALAALVVVFTVLWFFSKILKDTWVGIATVFFLCTSHGYIDQHVTRTGDYDSLLICFLTLYFFMGITFIITKQYKYYLLFCAFLFCAIFTKSVGGLFFLPGVFIGFLLLGNLKQYLKLKFIMPMLMVFFIIFLYYYIRDYYNAGYIKTVFFEEVSGRLAGESFHTGHKWYYHFENMVNRTFIFGFPFLLLCLYNYKKYKDSERKLIFIISITLILFWIPISISVNKNYWYFAPSYVLLSMLSSFFLVYALRKIYNKINPKITQQAFLFLTLVLIFIIPFVVQMNEVVKLSTNTALAEMVKNRKIKANYSFLVNNYNSVPVFYMKKLRMENILVSIVNLNEVKIGSKLIVLNEVESKMLKEKYDYKIFDKKDNFELVQVLRLKDKPLN